MKKLLRLIISASILFAGAASAFSFGKKDVSYRNVEDMDSWQETFDINEKKEATE